VAGIGTPSVSSNLPTGGLQWELFPSSSFVERPDRLYSRRRVPFLDCQVESPETPFKWRGVGKKGGIESPLSGRRQEKSSFLEVLLGAEVEKARAGVVRN